MRLLLLVLLCSAAASAQSGFEGALTSDQQSYAYGETITLTYTLTNTTSEVIEFYASSGCGGAALYVGDLQFPQICTTDSVVYIFDPAESNSWIWVLVPSELGIPERDGEQEATGYHFTDSTATAARVTYNAPRFLGGAVSVGFDAADAQAIDDLRQSFGAEVIDTFDFGDQMAEIWRLDGITVSDAIAQLTAESIVRYAERPLTFLGSVYTPVEGGPETSVMTAPAPNPTASQATFTVGLERPGAALVDLVDVRGRRVAVLFDGPLSGERTFTVSTAGLPAGVYLVRVVAGGVRQSHRLTVVR